MQASSRSVVQVAALLAAVLSVTGAAGAAAYDNPHTNLLGHTIQDAIGCFDSHTIQDCLAFHDPPPSEYDDRNVVLFSSIFDGAGLSFFDESAGLGSIAGAAVLLDDFAGATGIGLAFSGATIDRIERDHRAVHQTALAATGAATNGIGSGGSPVPAPGVLPLLGIAALLAGGRRPRLV